MNRLIQVTGNGKLLREYGYDAFGNRTMKKEYGDENERIIQYRYNEKNQLISEIDNELEKDYRYDSRGNMTEVSIGGKKIKQFTFDAANRMSSSAAIVDNLIKKAEYRYNGLGQRVGQDIWRMEKGDTDAVEMPSEKIRYTIDLTRVYHNTLCRETEDKKQTFYWDSNVTAMEECGTESYYIQDDLGSPMLFTDEEGEIRETYGFDEFGLNLYNNNERQIQPFGFTGYQLDEAGGLYFAQARRYDAGVGRFVSEDFIKGSIAAPFTLNHYGYCWNRPLDLVDLDGMFPEIPDWVKVVGTVAVVAGAVVLVTVVAPETIAAALVYEVAAGAVTGGVVGGVSNVVSDSGSFANGFVGGAVNGAISVGFGSSPIAYAAGGAVGSLITDTLNNADKPEEEQKSLPEILYSAAMAGGAQACVSSVLDRVEDNAVGDVGVSVAAGTAWDVLFSGGISFSAGTIASIAAGEVWKAIQESIGLSDDNSVKE